MGRWAQGPETLAYVACLRLDPCCYCHGAAGTIDHIVPIRQTRGEERRRLKKWWNLTAACETCNVAKSDRSLVEFLRMRIGEGLN